jgi:hypothetical protein
MVGYSNTTYTGPPRSRYLFHVVSTQTTAASFIKTYHNKSTSLYHHWTDYHYTKYIQGYNHYLVTNAGRTSQYTEKTKKNIH